MMITKEKKNKAIKAAKKNKNCVIFEHKDN